MCKSLWSLLKAKELLTSCFTVKIRVIIWIHRVIKGGEKPNISPTILCLRFSCEHMDKLLLFKFILLFLVTMGLSPSFRLEYLLACSSVGLMQAAPATVSSCEFNNHTVCRQLCFTMVLLNPTFFYCTFYPVHLLQSFLIRWSWNPLLL